MNAEPWVAWLVAMAALGAALVLLDRLLLAMEARGWLYYRKNKPKATAVGTALLELQSLLEPRTRHVVEAKEDQRREEDDDAGPGRPSPRR